MAVSLPGLRRALATSADLTTPVRGQRPYGLIGLSVIFALLAVFAPPTLALSVLGGVALAAIVLAHPVIAVYLLVFTVPYGSIHDVSLGGLNATLTEVLALLGGLAFFARSAIEGRLLPIRWGWWMTPLFIFAAALIVSTSQATDLKSSIKELLKLAEEILVYVLVLVYVDTPAKLRRLLLLLVLAAFSQALLGILQSTVHFGPTAFLRGGALRSSGTFEQPNPYAGYLNFTLPLLIAAVITNVPLVGRLTRPALVAVAAALLLSVSRGALLATIIAVAVMLSITTPRVRPLVGAAVAALVALVAGGVVGVVPSTVIDPIAEAFGVANIDVSAPTPANWAAAERLAHQLSGLAMFANHPILGVGPGNYAAVYSQYKQLGPWDPALGHAHNYYINIAAEGGIVGLAAFLIVLVGAFVIAVRLYRHAPTPLARTIALGTIGVLTTVTVHNNFDNIFVHAMEAQLALVIGLATVVSRLERDQAPGASRQIPTGLSQPLWTTRRPRYAVSGTRYGAATLTTDH